MSLQEQWAVAPGDARLVLVPGLRKPINAGSAERALLIVEAVNGYSARAVAERRFTAEGAQATPGAANPYQPGSAAATWWDRGRAAAG